MPAINAVETSSDDDHGEDEDDVVGELEFSGGAEHASGDVTDKRLLIQTDIADDGPTGFSYDKNR